MLRAKTGPGDLTMAEIGRMGGRKTAEKGSEYYVELGRKGGKATCATHDRAYYVEIGRKGGQKANHREQT